MKKMVLVLTAKTNYRYYLANGACIEYALSPGCSLVQVIDDIVASHYNASHDYALEIVWVQPEIASALNKEVAKHSSLYLRALHDPGMGVLKFQTMLGPVTIVAKSDLEIPIFFGSEQELKDNSFNDSMEKILCE